MLAQKDNRLWHSTNAALRLVLYKGALNSFANFVLVNEFPKSGGSWLSQMLSESLGLPFPRNRLPLLRDCILQGHYLAESSIEKRVLIWRDGRDVAVSWYHHFVVGHSMSSAAVVRRMRAETAYNPKLDDKTNFSQALRVFLDRPVHPKFTWAEFVDYWLHDESSLHVKYEDLKNSTEEQLAWMTEKLREQRVDANTLAEVVKKYSFARQAGRAAGIENNRSFLRKGVIGDWHNYFDRVDGELFHNKAGKQLIALGYETDRSWVDRLSDDSFSSMDCQA